MKLKTFLKAVSCVLLASGAIDLWLWFSKGYHVPSWTIGIMSIFTAVVVIILQRYGG